MAYLLDVHEAALSTRGQIRGYVVTSRPLERSARGQKPLNRGKIKERGTSKISGNIDGHMIEPSSKWSLRNSP